MAGAKLQIRNFYRTLLCGSALLFLAGCYSGPHNGSVLEFLTFQPSYNAYTAPGPVNVEVNGWTSGGTLDVYNDLGEHLSFTGDGTMQFPTLIKLGSTYGVHVTVPTVSPQLDCIISNPNGPIKYPLTTIYVTCGLVFHDLSVQVFGLDPSIASSSPLVLQSLSDSLSITSDTTTAKTFPTQIGDTSTYTITIASVPTGHTCFFPNADGTGSMTGNITVKVDCVSVLSVLPSSNLVGGTDKIAINLSYHGALSGCSYLATGSSTRQDVISLSPQPTISYPSAPNDNMIVLIPDATTLWGPGGDSVVQLQGCTSNGQPINGGNPIYYEFTATGNIRYVDISSGNDANNCTDGTTNVCQTIQAGIAACGSTASCSVYIAQGIYPITSQLQLDSKTSLVGGFPSGFTGAGPDLSTYPTILQDQTTSCGTSYTALCSPINITTALLNPASISLTVSNLRIQIHPTASYATGILVDGAAFNSGQIRISDNFIYGYEGSASATAGERTGVVVRSSKNVVLIGNWIRGDSGASVSAAVHLDDANATFLLYNILDSLVTTTGGYSTGVQMDNIASGSVVGIANNKINPYQYILTGLTPTKSNGITVASTSSIGSVYIFNNDIFVGNSSAATLGDATGIYSLASGGNIYNIFNNQIFGRTSLGNRAGIYFQNSPSTSTNVLGNNFNVGIPILVGATQYTFCGSVLAAGCINVLLVQTPVGPINSAGIGTYANNYGDNPMFKSISGVAQISDIWRFNSTTGTPSAANTPCTSMYGGKNISSYIPTFLVPFFITDFDLHTRTTTSYSLTPSGADSISIGVYEIDANCQ
ncbi:hypothetical protein EHQ53_01995 [Leptospira langatensis]|uniref:Uncharacterized protein n=1 Tax=Leptospira langatensis TaxID=2484983 RepID=A0A5F1ZWW9_9LEPT|nr:hypothetical protein [Leptospira langatensis]TGJ98516.1 hypothetical protein EHO57_18135 [Leptospira langatensis]TGL43431.1 hypothetical protein EHQ53_01995 [Leptospira langatensis]